MTKENFANKSPDITTEACAWIAQLETGNMSEKDSEALGEWINRSPRHLQEIKKFAQLSGDINVLAGFAGPLNVAAKERLAVSRNKSTGSVLKGRRFAVACVALVCVLAVGLVTLNQTAQGPYLITTVIGGLEEVTLSDGSVVKLNTNSQVEINFDENQRRVRLLRGEAFFEVAHNKKRPFIVYAGDKFVRAVGTAFSVRWTQGDLTITVSEGRVSFAPIIRGVTAQPVVESQIKEDTEKVTVASLVAPLLIDAGQKLTLPEEEMDNLIEEITKRELVSEMSWQSGILDFTQRPLIEIIEEINRYTDVKIEITDPRLRKLRFSGIFRTGETGPLFEALELSFDIEVDRVNDKFVRIRPSDG
ncbi:FecR family protein [Paremcibacter congregatus]|uniref:Uncharacterized protein n=1 Tax=Paremcibacter congregatus TaxID=2043170 RepID=A0A2G4YVI1_9PROT|nr:FecR domain-containing protein [Paremcibacter congregatus]PHZ86362.1 hypothetical protein CRD36_02035 [Paremcibacter congregatus]QDE27992.1 DUF4974 domain-containing protein [Paremcibacter congregatus]